ncbi:TspO/MBR family protein [Methylobacterium segetis]|uniref:TspO/MBR family protein n=1 Tax=Methylobacterium segetis TaxID=2488750 RepID=UPI001052188C|nr:TspO/MBR family protein [Methylobacterium segetis]
MTQAGPDGATYLVAGAAALAVALAGGLLTAVGPRSRALRRPAWRPPDWAFGPVWAVIFAMITVSAALAWSAAADVSARAVLLAAYAVNAVLNIAWSGLFFRAERPDWALLDIALLWLSILALILVSLPLSLKAALLLLPYLGWVGIAACLNLAIVRLNGPFGRA